MTLREIRSKICTLRNKVEDLSAAAEEIWLADGEDSEEADDLKMALDDIATELAQLEEDEVQ